MAIISVSGIQQLTTATDLQIIGSDDIVAKLGDAAGAKLFKVNDSGDSTVFQVDSDGNTRVYGNLTVDGSKTTVNSNNVLFDDNILNLNSDAIVSASNQDGGLFVVRASGASSFTTTSFTNSTNTIAMTDDATTQLAIGDIFIVSGSANNDGLYEVSTVSAGSIVINTGSTIPGVLTSLTDETVAAEVNEANHSFFTWDESTDRWEFGYYSDAAARSEFQVVGIGSGGAAAFSNSNPDLSAQGTGATNSGAVNIGVFDEFANSSSTNVQDVLDDLDAAITSASIVFGTPALVFSTANAAGSTDEAIRRDATIALFDATVPTTIQPDDAASVGSAGVAARRDHTHAIAADVPVEIGNANTEGSATSFARSDHVHLLDTADGDVLKSGSASIGNGASSVVVSFSTAFPTAISAVVGQVVNVTDGSPLHFTTLVTASATTGFTIQLSGLTDSANYVLHWKASGN